MMKKNPQIQILILILDFMIMKKL